MPDRSLLAVIVTAYRPDDSLVMRFGPLLALSRWIIVVDNTPGAHPFEPLPEGFIVVQDGVNKGLGPALNVGLHEALRLGAQRAILFDQDSTPSVEFLSRMLDKLDQAQGAWGHRCCVGPTHVDDAAMTSDGPEGLQRRHHSTDSAWENVTCLPTSGMTFAIDALRPDEQFSDEFFLDLVDFEWCWRLRHQGWKFIRTTDVRMFHRLGLQARRIFGLTFHVPAPYRHYFQFRDTLRLAIKAYVPTYSKLRLIGILPLKAVAYPFLLDRGLERFTWMLRGVRDSFRGIRGVGAAASRLAR
jgi:rhamnosyltransferase